MLLTQQINKTIMQLNPQYHIFFRLLKGDETIIAISNYDLQTKVDDTTYTSHKTMSFDIINFNSTLDDYNSTITFIFTKKQRDIITKNHDLVAEISFVEIGENEHKKIILRRGSVGTVKIEGKKISLEIKSIADILNNKVNRRYGSVLAIKS